ncbi:MULTISPECIES: hypothetical protein [unclassified Mesorhizobium]|uniref:hypothetical protein n=1 Tax=unclassified Mesorhizobium TaxID=325217 RepID=UPI000FD617DE|nr:MULTISPECIES: hypothetical protein [unclassified Mesorhizobium]RVB79838.1 hypothetical protein EN885_02845 [Mesorhizobium sp. M6A.T.Cr.TU.014.01.1.1]RWP73800.1 MAG: hypothetical protein EOR09_17690 [Mesorhizobium sp.]RWP81812.1 MAG: hypothetical protein EOR10_04100 [Mesorhizobium sp.]RWQ08743.1 MAG: hypothetical protein EOR90_09370 [Mesorhizobium sp.]RWQ12400.1 MAG: hypothetical protein EOR91_01430 [Mesorhizobium sp.]
MPFPPSLKQACLVVARTSGDFRKRTQMLIHQLGALDLDQTAQTYPRPIAEAMVGAEQGRISLIRALADFDAKCATLESAAKTVAQS